MPLTIEQQNLRSRADKILTRYLDGYKTIYMLSVNKKNPAILFAILMPTADVLNHASEHLRISYASALYELWLDYKINDKKTCLDFLQDFLKETNDVDIEGRQIWETLHAALSLNDLPNYEKEENKADEIVAGCVNAFRDTLQGPEIWFYSQQQIQKFIKDIQQDILNRLPLAQDLKLEDALIREMIQEIVRIMIEKLNKQTTCNFSEEQKCFLVANLSKLIAQDDAILEKYNTKCKQDEADFVLESYAKEIDFYRHRHGVKKTARNIQFRFGENQTVEIENRMQKLAI